MFNNPVLDVITGLVFIYLLYSLLATIVQEWIAVKLAFRSKLLEKSIIRMLEDGKSTTSYHVLDRLWGYWLMLGKPNLLKGRNVAAWFYVHPLIKYLGEDNFYSKPAYLSAENFSRVILDLLRGDATAGNGQQSVSNAIQQGVIYQLPVNLNSDKQNRAVQAVRLQLQSAGREAAVTKDAGEPLLADPLAAVKLNTDTTYFLQSLWRECGADVEGFRKKLEHWFDDTMERTTGWYKRYTRFILLLLGFLIAVSFNVDTVNIVRKLRRDPKLREQLVQSATVYVEKNRQLYTAGGQIVAERLQPVSDSLKQKSDSLMAAADRLLRDDIDGLNNIMGLGWKELEGHGAHANIRGLSFHGFLCGRCNPGLGWTSVIGWLITALAISLGAPFWFDLLKKLTSIRGTGGKAAAGSAPESQPAAAIASPVSAGIIISNEQNSEQAVG